MKCSDCKLAYMQDSGYSNYTVESTEWECQLDLNPSFPIENGAWWHEDKLKFDEALSYAKECNMFIEGEPDHYDVDGEEPKMSKERLQGIIREVKLKKLL